MLAKILRKIRTCMSENTRSQKSFGKTGKLNIITKQSETLLIFFPIQIPYISATGLYVKDPPLNGQHSFG